ncbi:MAG: amidohydrolase [Planctomycetota bacterium]
MSGFRLAGLLVAVVCLVTFACVQPPGLPDPADGADVVFLGGRFYTCDDSNPEVSAIAARDGWIVYAGDEAGASDFIGATTQVVDVAGATGFPGFTDSHVHIEGVGKREQLLDLRGTASLGELLQRLQQRVAETPPGQWIIGRGWIETFWEPARFPTRFDLDAVSPQHPVFLWRIDGHCAIVNTKALQLAGVDASTVAPPGGEILLKDGVPTGLLLDGAMGLVRRYMPPATAAEMRAQLTQGAETYGRRGWTGIQVAGHSWQQLSLLQELCAAGTVRLRVCDAIYGPGSEAERLIHNGAIGVARGSMFAARTIKISYDGALGSTGAALLEPYSDRPDTSGLLQHDDASLLRLLELALRGGIQVQVHAIGDRANRRILDLFEQAFARVPVAERRVAEPRWRVEHAQILHPDDIPRFAQLGVIPSMQPSHAITDLHFAPARLGRGRLRGAYAWRALIDSGCQIAGGTDAPVEAGDPLLEFYAACVRKDPRVGPDPVSGPGWHREQRVTRQEALQMFTTWAAHAAFQEEWRGTIAVGKACDLTLFSRDIMTVPEADILGARCVMTVVDGAVIYREADAKTAAR